MLCAPRRLIWLNAQPACCGVSGPALSLTICKVACLEAGLPCITTRSQKQRTQPLAPRKIMTRSASRCQIGARMRIRKSCGVRKPSASPDHRYGVLAHLARCYCGMHNCGLRLSHSRTTGGGHNGTRNPEANDGWSAGALSRACSNSQSRLLCVHRRKSPCKLR